MPHGRVFVGRKRELEQFNKMLVSPVGQAVVVIGPSGMGKSWLIDKMAEVAQEHPDLLCGTIRYELTSNDRVDTVMERMMNDAFDARHIAKGLFVGTDHRCNQWYALLEAVVPKGEKISKLLKSFERNMQRPTREEFIDRLRVVSKKMARNGRAVFLMDPLEYLHRKCGEEWAIVVRQLPEKVKLVFAQRPNDVLVNYPKFFRCPNVVTIPDGKLEKLQSDEVDELINIRVNETLYSISELRSGLERYDGHPYAVQGAIDLLARSEDIENLPEDPTEEGVAKGQWQHICKAGQDAIRLFKAYTILAVAVPGDVVEAVAKVNHDQSQELWARDAFLVKLLERDGNGRRIYHVLLTRVIRSDMTEEEKTVYHTRAIAAYRRKLAGATRKLIRPDSLSAERLPEHVLLVEGKDAFVRTFINESNEILCNQGLFATAIALTERALQMTQKGTESEAILLDNLGMIYYRYHGDLDRSEKMFHEALLIDEQINRLEGLACEYLHLGIILHSRRQFKKAETMYKKALEIELKLNRPRGITSACGNLGLLAQEGGDLGTAELAFKHALAISTHFGHNDLTANQYGNLGLIMMHKGKFDEAEDLFTKGIEIETRIGRAEGIACEYGNMGLLCQMRGDFKKSQLYLKKAKDIFKKIGMQHAEKKVNNLVVNQRRC
jgi:tetratricopeptide (TPR) repeat protein